MIFLLVFILYLLFFASFNYFLARKKKDFSPQINSWIYAFALPASFLSGWAYLGVSVDFVKGDLTFLSFYLGVIIFTLLFPFLLERVYLILERYNVSDVVSFLDLRYKSHFFKNILITFISLIVVFYVVININALKFLMQTAGLYWNIWFLLIFLLALIFVFVLFVRGWKGVTVVAFQGFFMIVCSIILGIFVLFFVFNGPSDIFSPLIGSIFEKNLLISYKNTENFMPYWTMISLTSFFAFLFLPRQFNILSQGMNLPVKEKIFKTSISIIIYFVIFHLIYSVSIGGGFMAFAVQNSTLNWMNLEKPYVVFFIERYGNLFLFIVFFIGGLSFILSTLNQELSAASDILKKHWNWNIAFSIFFFLGVGFLITYLFQNVFLHKLGVFIFIGVFQMAIPVFGGLFWHKGNSSGASAGFLAGFILWFFIGGMHFLADPSNFSHQQALLSDDFHFLKKQNYFLLTFLFSTFCNLIFYILFSVFTKESFTFPSLYLGLQEKIEVDKSNFEKILSTFHYDIDTIVLLAIFYNNKQLSFDLGELKEYIKIENIHKKINFLLFHHFIIEKQEKEGKSYCFNEKILKKYNLEEFFEQFYTFKFLLDKTTKSLKDNKKIIENQLSQMQILYKIYMKILAINRKKDFFIEIGKTLSLFYPGIVKIEFIRENKIIPLFHKQEILQQTYDFKINLTGKEFINISFDNEKDMDNFFMLEPVLAISYRVILYIEKIKNYARRLKSLDTIRSHFISNISHELRTPLVPIKGYIGMLSRHPFIENNEDLKDIIKTMEISYKRLENLIENLIMFKEVSFDFFNTQKINILELIFNIITEIKEKLREKEITIHFQEENFLKMECEGDRDKLKLALLQIIDNAIKFNRPKGKILLSGKEDEDFIFIKVKDNGIGMNADVLKRVFEAFYQGESYASRRFEGLGLGLSLVKKILILHNGKIKIKSEEHKGTTIYLKIPKKIYIEDELDRG